jgi:HEAT repeat protein
MKNGESPTPRGGTGKEISTQGAVGKLLYYSGSDIELWQVVKWVGASLMGLTLLLLILLLVLRSRLLLREVRRRRFLNVWQPILTSSVEVPSSDVPRLARRDLTDFLVIWNHLHESLLDESKDHLNQIAKALRIGEQVSGMLRRGNRRERLLAAITLGQLGERAAWDALSQIAQEEDALLSVAAARALIMIDATRAVPLLIPLLTRRPDWPASRVATMLQTAGAAIISGPLARAAIASSQEARIEESNGATGAQAINYSARLIRYLELADSVSALPAIRAIVGSAHDPETLAACLRLLESAEDLKVVRDCLAHEDWRVRVQAASALGRIGVAEDERRLTPLLSDKEWWVRYRAAQALSRLPSMRTSKLKSLRDEQSDPFARDILAQVVAEVELQ